MKEIYTEIKINAPSQVVWNILTDFNKFPDWNPFIQKISGNLSVGSQLEIFIKPPQSSGMNFKPTVLRCIDKKEIKWLGNLWIPNLFDGEHNLVIKEIDQNNVLFIQKELFNGILVPFFSNMLKNTKSGFEMMNVALKKRAEEIKNI